MLMPLHVVDGSETFLTLRQRSVKLLEFCQDIEQPLTGRVILMPELWVKSEGAGAAHSAMGPVVAETAVSGAPFCQDRAWRLARAVESAGPTRPICTWSTWTKVFHRKMSIAGC